MESGFRGHVTFTSTVFDDRLKVRKEAIVDVFKCLLFRIVQLTAVYDGDGLLQQIQDIVELVL